MRKAVTTRDAETVIEVADEIVDIPQFLNHVKGGA
jgi:hypothetical protein